MKDKRLLAALAAVIALAAGLVLLMNRRRARQDA